MNNFDEATVKKYLPLLLRNMTTGKDFDFDYERDFKLGYERNREEVKTDSKKRAAIYTPPHVIREMVSRDIIYEKFIRESKNGGDWQRILDATFLEPACGEAPFCAMRYHMVTGARIEFEDREGILDWKMKAVNFHLNMMIGPLGAWGEGPYSHWYPLVKRAFQTVYGTDKYLPSLIIARVNMLLSFIEYTRAEHGRRKYFCDKECPPEEHIKEIAEIICWNFWQMDFLNPGDELVKNWATRKVSRFRDSLKAESHKCVEGLIKTEQQLTFDF